jgi:hypothetical protein
MEASPKTTTNFLKQELKINLRQSNHEFYKEMLTSPQK